MVVKPPKWMVKILENPIKMDDLGGKPSPIFGSTALLDFGKSVGKMTILMGNSLMKVAKLRRKLHQLPSMQFSVL